METNVLRKHFDYLIQCTEKLQLSKHVFERYKNHYEEIFLYCSENHLDIFTHQDAAVYCKMKCPSRKEFAVRDTTKIAYTVAGYFVDGCFAWKAVTFPRYPVCSAYETLMDEFRQELLKKLGPGTPTPPLAWILHCICSGESIRLPDILIDCRGWCGLKYRRCCLAKDYIAWKVSPRSFANSSA